MQNNKKYIILIAGKSGAGKNKVQDIIEEICFHDAKPYMSMAFAVQLKEHLSRMFDIPLNHFYDEKLKEYPFKFPRELMNIVGTDLFRNSFDKNVWVKLWCKTIKKCYKNSEVVIVPDLRFKNEMEIVKEEFSNDYTVISLYVKRDSCNKFGYESENSLTSNDCSYIIDNNGTLEELETQVKAFLFKYVVVDL